MSGHPECYAQSLGGCSDQLSGEHYVSAKVLHAVAQTNNRVRVSGLRFLPSGLEQEIGISRLTSNILCSTHNSALSDYDAAGLTFFNAMERVMVPASPVVPLRVSGKHLETWLLKTLVGGVFCGGFPLPTELERKGVPPPVGFLRALFTAERLPEPLGLYLYHGVEGEKFLTDHHVLRIQVVPGKSTDGEPRSVICGLAMWVFGIEFYLSVLPFPDPLPGRWQHTVYRPTEIAGPEGDSLVIAWEGIGGDRHVQFCEARSAERATDA
jgi:hypothetical protein